MTRASMHTGPRDWLPPPDVLDAGEATPIEYTGYPRLSQLSAHDQRYHGEKRTQLPLPRGLVLIRNHIVAMFGIKQTYMPGRSRPMEPTMRLDAHQAGRAVDFMTYGDVELGRAVANHLVLNADHYGIKLVIHARNQWVAKHDRAARWDLYDGAAAHRDHPHVEITEAAARMETPFFSVCRGDDCTDEHLVALASGEPAPFGDEGATEVLASWLTRTA